jgi:hypothetical protein
MPSIIYVGIIDVPAGSPPVKSNRTNNKIADDIANISKKAIAGINWFDEHQWICSFCKNKSSYHYSTRRAEETTFTW